MINKNSKNPDKTWTIYRHSCHQNGFSYIGQTSAASMLYRWGQFGTKYNHSGIFWSAIQKYDWENFDHEILETGIKTLTEANEREKYWIAYYHTYIGDPECRGYNATRGGDNTTYIVSDETRLKMSENKKGKKHSIEYKKALSKLLGGKEIICIETQQVYFGLNEAYRQTGIRHILECCQHKRFVAGGYHWSFIDDAAWQLQFQEFIGCPQKITKQAKRAVQCIETQEVFESITAAKHKYSCCISKVLSGEGELAGGYYWRYIDD